MLHRRRFLSIAAAVAAPTILSSRALSAVWPTKPVRIVVPFTPGGSTDITARLVGNRLQEIWGQSVVIENRGGAGGNIAADMVAHGEADGYTIFISGPGMATNQFLYPSLTYDPVGDFAPVSMLILQPNMMCVPNTSPAKSVKESSISATPTKARSPSPRPATAPRCICRASCSSAWRRWR